MVNSWECLCLILSKHITQLPSCESFFSIDDDSQILRTDDSRIAVIILTKILQYIQIQKKDCISHVDKQKFLQCSEQLVLSIQEYMLNPVSDLTF